MKIFIRIIQFLTGALFIFSGFVKAIDPLGTAYKMHDYFTAFETDFASFKWLWTFMNNTSVFWSVFMIVFELLLGFALIIGYRHKLTLWLTLLLMLFFTFLTGYTYLSGYTVESFFKFSSWVFNEKDMKVTDCGCFGDFIKLKPYTSFWKDVILDVIIILLLIFRKHLYTLLKDMKGTLAVGIAGLASLLFCFSNYMWGLPMIDFRPYKVGTNLKEAMTLPPNAKKDSVAMVFIYEKGGKQIELSVEQISQVDSTYKFIDRKDKLIVEGDKPKIHDFGIVDAEGNSVLDDILSMPNAFILVTYDIDQANEKVQSKANDFANLCSKSGIEFIGLTGSVPAKTEAFRHEHQNPFAYYFCDATALKTMIRSNPGLVHLQKGVVKNMWHHSNFPTFDEVKKTF